MGDRHAFRAKWYDYNDGIYFVTICCAEKKHLFGKITNGQIVLTELGQIANDSILDLPNHHAVDVWNYVVMPNHIHLVLHVGTRPAASAYNNSRPAASEPTKTASELTVFLTNLGCLKHPSHGKPCADFHHNSQLAVIVGGLKSAVTRKYRMLMRTRQAKYDVNADVDVDVDVDAAGRVPTVWQQRYHEHIIRNQRAFDNIMEYVSQNVERWGRDVFNQNNIETDNGTETK